MVLTTPRKVFLGAVLVVVLLVGVIGAVYSLNQAEKAEGTTIELINGRGDGQEIVKINYILGSPSDYYGQAVVVEGKIIAECGSGCWFILDDGTGTIYVDLAPSNLVIPQKQGAFARVYGNVAQKGGDTYLIGEKVEF